VPEQLMLYLYDVGRGNLGRSMTTGQLVTTDLRERLPGSLDLPLNALLIALVSAVPLGVLAALRSGSVMDHGVRLFCALGVCVPTFVSGLLLIYVFYYLLGLAPDPTGRVDIFASLPPSRTGFLLIDFLLAGDEHGGVRDSAAGGHHACLDAGLSWQRFRAHRPLRRPALVADRGDVRLAQRHPARHHHRWHRVFDHARRQCAGGEGV